MLNPKRFTVFPRRQIGWLGLGLTATFALTFILKVANLPVPLPIPTFAIFGVGLLGLVLNLWAFILGDRSWVLLALGLAIDAFMVTWLVAEVIFPH